MRTVLVVVLGIALGAPAGAQEATIRPARLRCEYRADPLGLDHAMPRLSWSVEATRAGLRDLRQFAYRIQAAGTLEELARGVDLLSDTGRIASDRTLNRPWPGPPLRSRQCVFWRVRSWDQDDRPSEWSPPAAFEVGLLEPADWQAAWIRLDRPEPGTPAAWYGPRPAPHLRKSFRVDKPVRRARAYVTGLGYYELRLNGAKVGDHCLDPGWTDYSKRVLYAVYDVTAQVRQGENAAGIILGTGWYDVLPLWGWGSAERNLRKHLTVGRPRALLQLEIEHEDGSRTMVVTDGSWRAAEGPIVRDSIYLGEEYDARRERPGWDLPGFDDAAWAPAVLAAEPLGPLHAQSAPPIRVTRTLRPVNIDEPKPGVFVIDFGEEFAGTVRLKVLGPRGARVSMLCGELLHPDGTVNARTSAAMQIKPGGARGGPGAPPDAFHRLTYVLKGEGLETYTPRFTYSGFRWVEMTGFPGRPDFDALDGLQMNSDVEPAGDFACASELLNGIHEACRRTFLSNLFSVQSDCPHREKFGYGGDLVATMDAFAWNFDMAAFYAKVADDFVDAQRPNGGFTETAPYVGIADAGLGEGAGPVEWGTALPVLCDLLERRYGNRAAVEEAWPRVRRWMDLLEARSTDGVLVNGIGDHESLVPKDTGVTGTAFLAWNARLAEGLAFIAGSLDDSGHYRRLAEAASLAIERHFLDPDTGRVASGTQCNQALALLQSERPASPASRGVLRVLLEDLEVTHQGHLTTGIFGTQSVLAVLRWVDRPDLLSLVLGQTSFPSFGFMLERGATTLWETWAPSADVYSRNHPMFGSADEALYEGIAGLRFVSVGRSLRLVVVVPDFGAAQPRLTGINWARGAYQVPEGVIQSVWRRDDETVRLELSVPPNTEAAVFLPAVSLPWVTESGRPPPSNPGVLSEDLIWPGEWPVRLTITGAEGFRLPVGKTTGTAVYWLASGDYRFTALTPLAARRTPLMRSLIWSAAILSAATLGWMPAMSPAQDATLAPSNLRCEYLTDPLAVDAKDPRLSWILTATPGTRGRRQTAYQVLVADRPEALRTDQGNLWDSGKVASDATSQIAYAGTPLKSKQRAWWKVKVWDNEDKASSWSRPASWAAGLLAPEDWGASWIGDPAVTPPEDLKPLPAPLLRKRFEVTAKPEAIKRATVWATALGLYELRLNGKKVGDRVLAPEWTDYKVRVQYQAYDVTDLLRSGENVLGAMLGDGWYAGRIGLTGTVKNGPVRAIYGRYPRLLARLEIELADGSVQSVVTDGSWRTTTEGPVRVGDLLEGETYDARRELAGWDAPGFDDQSWTPAGTFPGIAVKVVAQRNEPIRIHQELKPAGLTEPAPGTYVFDLGQNFAGWCRLKLTGEPGATITLRHSEVLNPDGTLYTANLRAAKQTDVYVCKGGGPEVFEPHFTQHGFRYVEVTGLGTKPDVNDLTGRVFNSAATEVGTFECSNPILNRLMRNVLWTQRANLMSTPTDCPQRDERMGWMGDILAFAPTACFTMDLAAFFTKWLQDVRDDQVEDGRYPDFAPQPFEPAKRFSGVPAWGDAGVFVPWTAYRVYGDTRILAEHFDSARRWVDWIHAQNPELLWKNARHNDYGDWLNADTLKLENWPAKGAEMPKEAFATAFFARSTELVAAMARVLGKTEDAERYAKLAADIKAAFQKAYVKPDGQMEGDTQAGYALALHFGLVPEDLRKAAAERMVDRFKPYDGHISTGFHSTAPLMHQLTAFGYHDDAWRLITKRTMPSWGYAIDHGATTIWERWDGFVAGRGFQDPGMNSFAHYALGSVGEWVYQTVAGFELDPEIPAWKRFCIHPRPGGGLTRARAATTTIHGRIASEWEIHEGRISLTATVPPNTTATIFVPTTDPASVTENGKPAERSPGLKLLRTEDRAAVFEAGSGTYRFEARLKS